MNLNKRYIVLAAALLIGLLIPFTACRAKTPGNPSGVSPTPTAVQPTPTPQESLIGYFPLKVGNTWEYEGQGMEYAAYRQWVKYEADGRYQVMVDNGGTLIASVFEVKKDSIVTTYKESEAGKDKNVLNEKSNINITVLKLPLEKGATWVSEDNSYSIVQTDATVTVPAGTFDNCIVVKTVFKDQASYMLFYYKKGIGLVQSEFHPENNGDIVSSKLKTYNVK